MEGCWGCLVPFNDAFRQVNLSEYDIWMGRGNECHGDAQYDDISISKLHCRLYLEQDPETGEYVPWIMDNSSNGTYVNGDLLGRGNQTILREGDYITLAVQSTTSSDWKDDSIGYVFTDMRANIPGLIPEETLPQATPVTTEKRKKKKRSRVAVPEPEPEPEPEPQPEAELELELELEPEPIPEPKPRIKKKKSGSRMSSVEPTPEPPSSSSGVSSKLRERLERRKMAGAAGTISMKETDRERAAEEAAAAAAAAAADTEAEAGSAPEVQEEVEKKGSRRSSKATSSAPPPEPELVTAAQKRLQEKQRQRLSVHSVASKFEEKKQEEEDKKDKKKLVTAAMNPETPSEFISCLRIEPLPRVLQGLRRYLNDQVEGGEFLQKFVDLDGFVVLIDNLVLKSRKFKKTNMDLSVEIEIVKCLKVLLNDEYGLKNALAMGVNFFGPFVLSIESDNKRMRRRVPKIMGAVAAYSQEGHSGIVESLNYFKKIKNERLRFQKIVKMLSTEDDLEFRVNILLLINAVINFPPEVENRINLREEFLRLGLKEILEALKGEDDQALFTQVEQFFQEMEKDQRDVQMRGIDITNPTAIVDLLTSQLYGTPAFNYFTKIIQQFLLIRATPEGREKWIKLSGVIQEEILGEEYDLASIKAQVESSLDEEAATMDGDTAFMRKELLDLKRKYDKSLMEKLEEQRKAENEKKTLLEQLERLKEEVGVLKGLPSLVTLPAPKAEGEEEKTEEETPPGAPPPPPAPGKGPPPPPPGGLKAKAKAKYQPSVPMKQLYWNKIQERKLEGTVWKALNYDKVDLVPGEIEDLFAARKKKEKEKEEVKKEEGPKVVSFVDLKRANNVGIMLATFKLTDGAIRRAVLDFDEATLTAEKTVQLLKNLPTVEEEDILKNYQGEPSQLGRVEQFFHQLVTIPRLKSRVEVLHSRWTMGDKLADTVHNVETITMASRELVSNQNLGKILEILLAVGNFMNFGPMKPTTTGFRIEFLTKLRDVRTNDNKSTLLHYIANFLAQRHPELLEFSKEISHVEPASKISQKLISGEMISLKTALEQIKSELKAVDGKDGLFEVMGPFHEEMKNKLDTLSTEITVMNEWLKKTVEWFGEDSNVPVEEILQTISTFAINLDVAVRDNAREQALAEKNKRMEEKRAADKLAKEEAKAKAAAEREAAAEQGAEDEAETAQARPGRANRPGRRGGVLDKVSNQLRTGTIYRGKKGQQMLEEDQWENDLVGEEE